METRNGFEVLFAVLMPVMHSESLVDHRKAEGIIAQLVTRGEKEQDATLVGMLRQTSSYMAQHTRVLEVRAGSAHTSEWPCCRSYGLNTEPRDSPNEPQASPPGGFPSAFNRGSPIEPSIETLSRVHAREPQVRGVCSKTRHSDVYVGSNGCGLLCFSCSASGGTRAATAPSAAGARPRRWSIWRVS